MIKKYSFHQLIREHIIEVPIIQRDYAQGRTSDNVTYIRERFVESLVKHVVTSKNLHLGFVYGKIEGKDRARELKLHEEAVNTLLHSVKQYANQFQITVKSSVETQVVHQSSSLRFIPLDGQQRLTTLFLLYWYISMRKGELNSAENSFLSNFKYNNRKASLSFFDQLIDTKNIQLIKNELKPDIENQLKQYTWYLNKWDFDATVSGVLVMVQAIHKEFSKFPDFVFENVYIKNLPFEFDFLDLDELKQSDELYIKMNERGKQLTDFEHFKAWLQDFTDRKYIEKEQKDFLKSFWKKIDTEWLDFFWKHIDADYRSLDDFYFNYLKTMAITYHCATDKSDVIPSHLKELLQQIRNTETYDQKSVSYIPLSSFVKQLKREDNKIIDFELFSIDCLEFIADSFETAIQINNNDLKKQIDEVVKSPFVSKSIVQSLIRQKSYTLNLWDHTFYYFLLRLIQQNVSQEFINDWLRIFRNIIYNTYVQSPENLYDALHSINELMNLKFENINNEIQKETFQLRFFNQTQIKEEVLKIQLLNNFEENDLIENRWDSKEFFRIENHAYFYGQINFILQLSNFKYDKFCEYSVLLEKLFSEDIPDYLLQQALLCKGDYLVHRTNHSFCKTTTDSLRSRNENWRSIFNNENKRAILKNLLDDLIKQQESELVKKLEKIVTSHNYTIDDWQYYFLENTRAVNECKYDEIRWFNDKNIRLLHSSTITGYHLELRTIYLFQKIIEEKINRNPFKSMEYLWDKNTGGHPGIKLINFSHNDKFYNLEIRFMFDEGSYELRFYNVADSVNQRFVEDIIINNLDNFSFDENMRHYIRPVLKEDILTVLSHLSKNLNQLSND